MLKVVQQLYYYCLVSIVPLRAGECVMKFLNPAFFQTITVTMILRPGWKVFLRRPCPGANWNNDRCKGIP